MFNEVFNDNVIRPEKGYDHEVRTSVRIR